MAQLSHFRESPSEPAEKRMLFQLLDSQTSEHPEKEAIVLYDEECQRFSMTFEEYRSKSQALAAALLEKGLARGDRVALISPNNMEYPVVVMALSRIGANVIAVEQGFEAEELLACLQELKCVAAVCYVDYKEKTRNQDTQTLIKRAATELPRFKAVVTIGSAVECGTPMDLVHSYSQLLFSGYKLSQSLVDEVQGSVRPDDPTVVLLTSGSTGKPKAAQFTYFSVVTTCLAAARAVRVSGTSIFFTDCPFSWIAGMFSGLNFVACTGATLVCIHPTAVVKKRLVDFALTVLQDEKCTNAMLLPYVIHDIVAAGPSLAKYDLSCLQFGLTGGQPLPQVIMKSLLSLLPGVTVSLGYGSTEGSMVTHQMLDSSSIDCLPYAWMQLLEHVEIKITDEEGRVMPVGTGGEINIRGPTLFTEYLENTSATSQAMTGDGWYHTSDMGVMDEKGRLKILGRKGDLMKRATESYYPAEFERVLLQHPLVARVVVIGVPDQRLYEEICACVILKNSHFEETQKAELEAWYEVRWPSHTDGLSWKPGHTVTFEKFPITRTGKPDRAAIKKIAIEKLGIKTQN